MASSIKTTAAVGVALASVVFAATTLALTTANGIPAAISGQAGSDSPELIQQIETQIAPLLPEGVRLRDVALGCEAPANAQLSQVAPGVSRLNSRGFVVELRDGERTLACSATLEAERRILVANHDIAQGQALGTGDFELRWIPAFGSSSDALSSLPSTGPLIAATAMRAGDALSPFQITRPLAIRPGDLVTVVVKNGPVTVRTQLESRSSASVGDSASLINPETGLPVTVTVTGAKSAELVMQ